MAAGERPDPGFHKTSNPKEVQALHSKGRITINDVKVALKMSGFSLQSRPSFALIRRRLNLHRKNADKIMA